MSKIKAGVDFIYNAEACAGLNTLCCASGRTLFIFITFITSLRLPLSAWRNAWLQTVLTAHDYKIVCPSYTMLRDGHVCEECLTGSVINAFVTAASRAILKSLLLSLEAYWRSSPKLRHARLYYRPERVYAPNSAA